MNKNYRKIAFLFALSFTVKNAQAEGFELKVKIKNLANKEIILGHHFADNLIPDDTLRLDQNGQGILKGNTKFTQGIYFFVTPSHQLFDFFMTENQHFSIENDTIDLFANLKFGNSPDNVAIWKYQRKLLADQKIVADIQEKKKSLTDENEVRILNAQTDKISGEFKNQTQKLISELKDDFTAKFINATQEITIPEPPKDSNGKILDSLFQYRFYRAHYFDNFDISDPRLLRTPIYEGKIKKYIEKVIPQIPDTINLECDMILEKAEKDKEVFRYMLITLFNYYATSPIMGFDAVYAHIAEKWYIPKASFSDTAFIRQTKETVEKLKTLLIGKIAPNLHMLWVPSEQFIESKTDSVTRTNPHLGTFVDLNNIDSKYTILVFWESDCSHCKKIIPELYEVYQNLKSKGVKAFAVHMLGGIEGKEKWISFVNEHEMYDWMNVWNPYDFSYKKFYDIRSTPVIFILDKDKKIIGKKLEPKQIEDYLNARIAQEEKK